MRNALAEGALHAALRGWHKSERRIDWCINPCHGDSTCRMNCEGGARRCMQPCVTQRTMQYATFPAIRAMGRLEKNDNIVTTMLAHEFTSMAAASCSKPSLRRPTCPGASYCCGAGWWWQCERRTDAGTGEIVRNVRAIDVTVKVRLIKRTYTSTCLQHGSRPRNT